MHSHYLYHALKALQEASKDVIRSNHIEKAEKTIYACSITATVAGVAAGIVPGAGAAIAASACVAAIWSMYVKINFDLGISISQNVLKSLASALLTNLLASAAFVAAAFVSSVVVGFIPGLQPLAAGIDAILSYVTVFASGVLYIKILTKVMKAKGTFVFDESEVKKLAKDVVDSSDVKGIVKEAKSSYKDAKKNGEL